MTKKQETEIAELKSKIFDMDREIFQLKEFEKIGDEKLLEAYVIVDKKQDIINSIKKLLKL